MNRTTVYIAGPMTGYPEYNYPAFFDAEEKLVARGFTVENPARNGPPPGLEGEKLYLWYLRAGFKQVLASDIMAVLPGWERSKGARREVQLAGWLQMPIHQLHDLLHLGPGEWLRAAKVITLREAYAQVS